MKLLAMFLGMAAGMALMVFPGYVEMRDGLRPGASVISSTGVMILVVSLLMYHIRRLESRVDDLAIRLRRKPA